MPRKTALQRNQSKIESLLVRGQKSCSTSNWLRSMAWRCGRLIRRSNGMRSVFPRISSFNSRPKRARL